MPTGTLPEEGKKLWEKVYEDRLAACKKKGGSDAECEESAARQAWVAVKRAGWYQDDDGNWRKRADIVSLSMRFEKASYDKKNNQMRWRAVASDTDTDLENDNMTLELFHDFIRRIESAEPPPERYRSKFWSGGMPYLSISHYPDMDGFGVPGEVESIYVDGSYLKAKGVFYDTPLGRACFKAVNNDLYGSEPPQNSVRISIGFLDYVHTHKDTQYRFERKSDEDICPQCFLDFMRQIEMTFGDADDEFIPAGKRFERGHLVHLAMTKVPINERTIMEVDKAMTTRLEDAASIVGEELAEELEKKFVEEFANKSAALITKSDDDDEEKPTEKSAEQAPEDDIGVEKAATKKEADCEHPASHYLVVEDSEKPSTWHLRVKDCEGNPDHRLMGAAWAALHEGYRGNKYEGPNKEEAIRKLKNLYKKEGLETPKSSAVDLDGIYSAIEEIKETIKARQHPLDEYLQALKSEFSRVVGEDMSVDDKLRALQEPFNALGDAIKSLISSEDSKDNEADVNKTLMNTMKSLNEQIAILNQRLQALEQRNSPGVGISVPARRSIPPSQVVNTATVQRSSTPKLRQIIERTTQ